MRDVLTNPAIDSTGNVDVISRTNTAAPTSTVYTSSSSDVDIEKQRSSAAESDPDVIHDHVDVQYAERQFADLKRRYSNLSRVASGGSQPSRRKSKILQREKTQDTLGDVSESEDEFDLEDVLRDRHRREIEHDIKPKHLGTLQSYF